MKATTLMMVFLFLVIISLVASDIVYTTTESFGSTVTGGGTSSASIFRMLKVFFQVLTFRIPEIPVLVNVLVFYPLALGMAYTIILILKDLVPFT